jgi:hypothetical protein
MLFGEGLGETLLLEFRGKQNVYFYECRKLRERQPRRGFLEIVEGNQIAHVLQAAAGGDDFIVGLNRLEDFQNDAIGRKRRGEIAKKKVAGAIDEGAAAVREAINAIGWRARNFSTDTFSFPIGRSLTFSEGERAETARAGSYAGG